MRKICKGKKKDFFARGEVSHYVSHAFAHIRAL